MNQRIILFIALLLLAGDISGQLFSLVNTGLQPLGNSRVAWGDFNNDGFTDLIFTGLDGYDVPRTQLCQHNGGGGGFTTNTPPSMPQGLAAYTNRLPLSGTHWKYQTGYQLDHLRPGGWHHPVSKPGTRYPDNTAPGSA